MFKIASFLLALALSQAVARKLSEELFYTYEPQTSVTDHVSLRQMELFHPFSFSSSLTLRFLFFAFSFAL
jgi:hypothetical protein